MKNLRLLSLHSLKKRLFTVADEVNGSVVQLVRMPPCHGGGRGFESRPVRRKLHSNVGLFVFKVVQEVLVVQ